MNKKNGVLLASGGLDSTTMAFWLINQHIEFVPLFINYGQHCAETEYETLKKVLPPSYVDKIEVIDISSIYKHSKSKFISPANLWEEEIVADDLYIPYRNVLLLTIGATFAQTLGLSNLYSAFINSNHAKEIDCSNEFFEKMEGMLSDYGSVKINMPFRYYSKYEVAKIGIELGATIGNTFSCQASPIVPCGACPNCVDRLDALRRIEQDFN
ncbi:7-cyano-7-deazaguanine synthase [Flavobacterium sp. HBTb2-11-1]|uniref:7-cyano-7-deazaguanine synthase n=1 Tax=Flavobacterium sp. HBTb2-11-1 TaxID=2692212 RepID=UPI00136C7A73|nr:7-cyano-7-deazaguanine synthase [Flavobacterium sp. HBTb2-11-1]MXO04616.1 7-cyano-7-deazaguanine synthase [Flavobacterium sp. HBTb2-11-1]